MSYRLEREKERELSASNTETLVGGKKKKKKEKKIQGKF